MAEPYFDDGTVTLYLGDCREITEWTTAAVLVTDPPYGMAYVSGYKARPITSDTTTETRDHVLALWGDRPAIMFGTWRATRPSGIRSIAVWDKTDGVGPGMGDLNLPVGSSHEEIYLLGGPWRRAGKRVGSVVRTHESPAALSNRHGHPTVKPVDLMEQLIGWTSGTVADPFAGSGSTLVAARNLGRRAIGIEIDEAYCETIVRRLQQQPLFTDMEVDGRG